MVSFLPMYIIMAQDFFHNSSKSIILLFLLMAGFMHFSTFINYVLSVVYENFPKHHLHSLFWYLCRSATRRTVSSSWPSTGWRSASRWPWPPSCPSSSSQSSASRSPRTSAATTSPTRTWCSSGVWWWLRPSSTGTFTSGSRSESCSLSGPSRDGGWWNLLFKKIEWIFTLFSLFGEWRQWSLLLEWKLSEPDEIPHIEYWIFTLLELESSEIH